MGETTTPLSWPEFEEVVLRWVLGSTDEALDLDFSASTSPLAPGLTDTQVDEALVRLEQHGLIAGIRREGSGAVWWSAVRSTADGLRVLGEWPPDEAAINDALVLILRKLAEDLPDEEATATRRAGSALGKMTVETVWDTVKGEARRAGGEIGS